MMDNDKSEIISTMNVFNLKSLSDILGVRNIDWNLPESPTIIALGNRTIELQHLSLVSMSYAKIELDESLLDSIDEKNIDSNDLNFDDYKLNLSYCDNDNFTPYTLCRAALFARLVSLMQGRSGVRSRVIKFLTNCLNDGNIPIFSNDESIVGSELVAFITGQVDKYYSKNGTIIYEKYNNTLTLTKTELQALLYGSFYVTGTTGLITYGAYQLINTLDLVGGMSCEAVGFDPIKFDALQYETYRQHRGQINSAMIMRQMLDSSKLIGVAFGHASILDEDIFTHSPQMHGPVMETLLQAFKTLQLELNSTESQTFSDNNCTGLNPSQTKICKVNVHASLEIILIASLRRTAAIKKESTSNLTNIRLENDPHDLILLQNVAEALYNELKTSDSKLDELKCPTGQQTDAQVNAAIKEAAMKAAADKEKFKPKQEIDPNLTPEQIAKIEKKRREKEEKAAAKAAAKAAKSGKGGGLVMGPPPGQGAYLFRQLLKSSNVLSSSNLFNPFNSSTSSFTTLSNDLRYKISNMTFRQLGIPRGTRDYTPQQMRIREIVLSTIRRVFKRHGAVELDTPVFELRDILMGKYGEDSKLIYDLADQGGELLSLRYDLTVPFARFLAMNTVGNIKRFHIAKVYRRDAPQMKRGRYREFYQCDFDIAGNFPPLVPDAEVITVGCEILSDLKVGKFKFKLNHRMLLDAIFEICGVPEDKFRPICSAVDKLDKLDWSDVKKEMIEEKGLNEQSADKIGEFVLHSGQPFELWNQLMSSNKFGDHKNANKAMNDLKILFEYLNAMGTLDNVSFDLSLARGLDYYTGVIYEAVLIDGESAVGSISAGGRYDNLVGMFSQDKSKGVGCVGVSIGVERVFTIIEAKAAAAGKGNQQNDIQVFVASVGGFLPDRMKITKLLWDNFISSEFSYKENPKLVKQMDEVLEKEIPFMVVIGETEIANSTCNLKDMGNNTEIAIPINELPQKLVELGCKKVTDANLTGLDF